MLLGLSIHVIFCIKYFNEIWEILWNNQDLNNH